MAKAAAVPDHLRCRRSDGRLWRCSRAAMPNRSFCELHYLQYRQNTNRSKCREKLRSAASKNSSQLELVRMVLKWQIERQNRKKEKIKSEKKIESGGQESMKELPNGVMAIARSPAPAPVRVDGGGGSWVCERKLGFDSSFLLRRYIRSKNVDNLPLGVFKIVPCGKKGAKRKCHQCRRRNAHGIIQCSLCKKELYCLSCIKEWYSEMSEEEFRMSCPVCRGTCNCQTCLKIKSKDGGCKDSARDLNKVNRISHAHYLICLLLPVLKQINQQYDIEVETEARIQGEKMYVNQLQQVECNYDEKLYCNNCKAFILDLHRTCSKCNKFDLCLSCCQELRGGVLPGSIGAVTFECSNKGNAYQRGDKSRGAGQIRPFKRTSRSSLVPSVIMPEWKARHDGSIPCPPEEFGGCGNSVLELRAVFPPNWTRILEATAEEIACSYEFPEDLDASSHCSFCLSLNDEARGLDKKLREASAREGTDDNYLYCPTMQDIQNEGLEHFQKHWIKGQPVIVRNMLPDSSELNWDPLVMFRAFLESYTDTGDDVQTVKATDCLDWCEVKISIQKFLKGYMEGRTHGNMWPEMLKLDLQPSKFLEEQLPSYHDQLINSLPFQEYTNPLFGLLNVALKLPKEFPRPDLGPRVHLSYGIAEELGRGDSVTKLHFDICDMVNVLTHATEVVIPSEQLSKIEKLKKKHKAQDEREFLAWTPTDHKVVDDVKLEVSLMNMEELNPTDRMNIAGGPHLSNGAFRGLCYSCVSPKYDEYDTYTEEVKLIDATDYGTGLKKYYCISPCSEKSECREKTGDRECKGGSIDYKQRLSSNSCGVRWDIFRRDDIPKLKAYLRKHFNEFRHTYCSPVEHITHPVHDQSFFLDAAHKKKLKEEFEIEPWTFEQHVGEGVMIPAGCPYQFRNLKSCMKVAIDFFSPENIRECIQLIDDLRFLPNSHKAKEDRLEVKKMCVCAISEAVKEIRELTSTAKASMELRKNKL